MPEGEWKEQEIENLFEKIMKGNFPNLVKEIDIQLQEAQRVSNKLDLKRTTPRNIIIKMPKLKDKERILKAAREKQRVTYKGVPMRLSADFSKDTLQARSYWQEVFKVMKSKDLHPRSLSPAKLSFRMEGQIKCFPDKVKLKEFIITKPSLHEMLRVLFKKKKVKTMNIKVVTNSQLSTTESKKQTKQTRRTEHRQNHGYGEHFDGC